MVWIRGWCGREWIRAEWWDAEMERERQNRSASNEREEERTSRKQRDKESAREKRKREANKQTERQENDRPAQAAEGCVVSSRPISFYTSYHLVSLHPLILYILWSWIITRRSTWYIISSIYPYYGYISCLGSAHINLPHTKHHFTQPNWVSHLSTYVYTSSYHTWSRYCTSCHLTYHSIILCHVLPLLYLL